MRSEKELAEQKKSLQRMLSQYNDHPFVKIPKKMRFAVLMNIELLDWVLNGKQGDDFDGPYYECRGYADNSLLGRSFPIGTFTVEDDAIEAGNNAIAELGVNYGFAVYEREGTHSRFMSCNKLNGV